MHHSCSDKTERQAQEKTKVELGHYSEDTKNKSRHEDAMCLRSHDQTLQFGRLGTSFRDFKSKLANSRQDFPGMISSRALRVSPCLNASIHTGIGNQHIERGGASRESSRCTRGH